MATHHTIRKVIISSGEVSTIAGRAGNQGSVDDTDLRHRSLRPSIWVGHSRYQPLHRGHEQSNDPEIGFHDNEGEHHYRQRRENAMRMGRSMSLASTARLEWLSIARATIAMLRTAATTKSEWWTSPRDRCAGGSGGLLGPFGLAIDATAGAAGAFICVRQLLATRFAK